MTQAPATAAATVGAWDVTLIEGDALYAPLRWVNPAAAESERAWLACHVLLCRRGEERILVDCGLGVFDDAFEGLPTRTIAVRELLVSIGCAPDEISGVVLTHFDPDHAGGVVSGKYPDGLRPALAGVPVFVSAVALAVGEGRGCARAEHAEQLVSALRSSAVELTGLQDGGSVTDGMRLRNAPGHREGHAVVEIENGGSRLVFLADVLHARDHVEHPEWDMLNDSDPQLGLATRQAWIDELAGSAAIVACSHIGGFGRIERTADGTPTWVDVP